MLKYMRADLYRITRQIPRYVLLVLFIGFYVVALTMEGVSKELNGLGLSTSANGAIPFLGAAIGVLELMAVFSEDFQAKTLQLAIGSGISRRHCMLSKLLEVTLLVLIDLLLCNVLLLVGGTIAHIRFQPMQLLQLFVSSFCVTLTCVVATDVTMILLFYTQKTGVAGIVFLLLYIDPVSFILSFFPTNEIILRLHLPELTFSNLIGDISTQVGLGIGFPIKSTLILCVYIVGFFFIGSTIFAKQELDF